MDPILSDIRSSLLAIVSAIDAHAEAPAPAPEPEPAPPAPPQSFVIVPVTYQLFGPVQSNGALSQVPGSAFAFQGQALTASCKFLHAMGALAEVEAARAVAVWAPGSASNEIEIVQFDGGPTNIERMGVFPGQNVSSPVVGETDLTAAFQALAAASRAGGPLGKQIGFRMKGNATYTLYEMRVEVAWRIPV